MKRKKRKNRNAYETLMKPNKNEKNDLEGKREEIGSPLSWENFKKCDKAQLLFSIAEKSKQKKLAYLLVMT